MKNILNTDTVSVKVLFTGDDSTFSFDIPLDAILVGLEAETIEWREYDPVYFESQVRVEAVSLAMDLFWDKTKNWDNFDINDFEASFTYIQSAGK